MRIVQNFKAMTATPSCGVMLKLLTPGGRVVVSLHRNADDGQALAMRAVTLEAAQINAAGWTTINWPPVKVDAGEELALVVTAGDTSTSLGVAQVGRKDPTAGAYVTTPAMELGALYSEDAKGNTKELPGTFLAVQLLRASYTEAEHIHDLGSFDVTEATDLAVKAGIIKPEAGADTTFIVTLPDAAGGSRSYEVDNEQRIELGERYTGAVQLSARLKRGDTMAPILEPGTTLLVGNVAPLADYVGATFAMSGGQRLLVTYEAHLPSGSGVTVQYQPSTADPVVGAWTPVPYSTNSGQTAGFVTVTHELPGIAAPNVRVRLLLSGTPTARPGVRNLVAVSL